jgi:hypothetical protein
VSPEGGPTVALDHVECAGDSIKVYFEAQEQPEVRVFADGSKLASLGGEYDESSGRGHAAAYPIMKEHGSIRIEVRADGKPRSEPAVVDLTLP